MKRTTSSGFTLVELLVVITIIGILMGLLIPAVNSAREVARRNQCSTNVKNLALAAVQYEGSKRELPGFVDKFGVFPGGGDRSDPANFGGTVPRHVKIGGFGVALLPWLDAQPTYEHWTQDNYPIIADGSAGSLGATRPMTGGAGGGFHVLAAPNLAIFQCPSTPTGVVDYGRNSYISNNGMSWWRTNEAARGSSPGYTNSHVGSQVIGNGVFNAKYIGVGAPSSPVQYGTGPKVTLDDMKDGQGFTAFFSENLIAMPWYLPGFIQGYDSNGGSSPLAVAAGVEDVSFGQVNPSWSASAPLGHMISSQFSNGWVWHYEDEQFSSLPDSPTGAACIDVLPKHRINGRNTAAGDTKDKFNLEMTRTASPDLARPSSAHVDGVNVGFADGATRFVSQRIDYRVYQALMTPRGKSSDVPWPEFILTDQLDE